jgi:hypothetical protein
MIKLMLLSREREKLKQKKGNKKNTTKRENERE